MMKHLLTLILFVCAAFALNSQVIYEDFEGGAAKITWNAINGLTYEGPVSNPSKDAVNGSDFVGKFTNDGISDFCFGLGDLSANADLSQYNLMKIKIWSPVAPTRALLKFEGGGKAIEKFIDITTANEWVEYSVDFSAAATFTTMNKVLLAFHPFTTPQANTFYFDDIRAVEAKEVYETFETGNEMGWTAFDGLLEAPVANPDPNKINSTSNVGKYTKSGAHSYSLLLAERTTPFDLSILNQFKLQIYSDGATQLLLKLEGPGGPAIEKIVNLGVRNAWQEYTFDLSAAKDYKHLTKAILFFDPGVETSADVYYYDNLYAVSQGDCALVVKDPNIVDDFECNRNATYVNGWDSLSVVPNPNPTPVNPSSLVGKYVDPQGEQWAALLIDYQNPVDLTTNNQLKVKIWSPKVTRVLFKLEGGASAAIETWVDITTPNQWVQYEVDFSTQALASHKKIVLFFNAGNDPAPGDVYYIDDISWGVKTIFDLENFENGATLPWEPLDQNTLIHGTFEVSDNLDPLGNTSLKVGKYTKGISAFSTLAAVAPGVIDISEKPQYNLDVWAPPGSNSITFQLESASAGNKEVTRNFQSPGAWETISFNFSEFQLLTDWEAIKLIFNPGVEEAGVVYYFDNLRQGESTVDPCEGAVPNTNIIDDFECQRNYEFGAGEQLLTVVDNPKLTASNSSTKVGLYKDQPNEPWAALCVNFPDGINLDVFNQFELQVLSTQVVPVLLKLEGGSSPAKEIWSEIKTFNDWYTLSVDFSGEKGNDHKRVCLFFNGGVETTTVEDYYIDNLKWAHAPYDGCIINYDDPAFVSDKWRYFPADESGGFELVDNPLKSGINTSDKVGKAIEKASGEQPWQGMYTDLDSYIKFGPNTIIKAKILSPKITTVTLKVERPLVPGFPGGSGDFTVANTKVNEWEELTWDFSQAPTPIDPAGQYARLTWIFDINNLPAEDVIYYFDDVRLEGGDCGQEPSSSDDQTVAKLSLVPNPVCDLLRVNNAELLKSTDIISVYGQIIARTWNNNQSTHYIDVSSLNAGTYFLMGYNDKQQLVAQSRFVKL
ncbi:MAG: T9SS type A sorting domain-containing protein [Saprospiraceae bacterium]|nr:T9SS type A sorting domain-containing protein [Saprospiraceae bacterium]